MEEALYRLFFIDCIKNMDTNQLEKMEMLEVVHLEICDNIISMCPYGEYRLKKEATKLRSIFQQNLKIIEKFNQK